ncbi:hypothetical protein EON66_01240 [archaeon]|nr:MAG: hypothetical protein EON66_01240 [archaeon]
MGVSGPGERSTICGEGCAMSSLSMALAAYGITINGTPSTGHPRGAHGVRLVLRTRCVDDVHARSWAEECT